MKAPLTTLKTFDIVSFLIALAARIAKRRHEKAVQREADLLAAIEITRSAYAKAVEHRVNTNWRAQDLKRVS
jgi:hypothetical protein